MWYKVQKNAGGDMIDPDGDKCILIETQIAYCLLDEDTLGRNEECGFRFFAKKEGAIKYFALKTPDEVEAESPTTTEEAAQEE